MTDPRTLSYTYDWRPDEHGRVVAELARERMRTPLFRAARWVIWLFLIFAALVAWAAWSGGDAGGAFRVAILIVIVGALITAFPWMVARLRVWMTRRHDPNVSDPLRYTLDAAGVRIEARTADTILRWDGLHKVREDRDFLLFYYSRWLAYYLPKRAVGPEIEDLRSWIREWLPEPIPFEGEPALKEEESAHGGRSTAANDDPGDAANDHPGNAAADQLGDVANDHPGDDVIVRERS